MIMNKWILRAASTNTSPQPRLRLFCFPHAGAGAHVYSIWLKNKLGPDIDVLPIELPGRNARFREARPTSMAAIVHDVLTGLTPLLLDSTTPYAFYGHSLGGWIAYAVTQELQTHPSIVSSHLPIALFVSGVRAPQLAGTAHDPDCITMHTLGFEAFWKNMDRRYGKNPELQDPDVRKVVFPQLQADFQVAETYRPARPSPPLACNLFVFGGESDVRYTREQLEGWSETVQGTLYDCEVVVFPGQHMFLFKEEESRDAVIEVLSDRIEKLLDGDEDGTGVEDSVSVVAERRQRHEGGGGGGGGVVGSTSGDRDRGVVVASSNTSAVNVGVGVAGGGGGGGGNAGSEVMSEAAATVASGSSYARYAPGGVGSITRSTVDGEMFDSSSAMGVGEEEGRDGPDGVRRTPGWCCFVWG